MADSTINALEVQDCLADVGAPRYGLCWMSVKEISAVGHLVSIKLTAEAEVSHAPCILCGDDLGVTLHIIDMLPGTEGRAHRRTDGQKSLLRLYFGPCPVPHLFLVEIPMSSVVVVGRQIPNAEARAELATADTRGGE